MDLSLSKDQCELVERVRLLAKEEIIPYCLNRDFPRDRAFDWHLVRKLGDHNLVCPMVPQEYGGLGLDIFTTALVVEELASACPGLAAVVDTNIHAIQPLLLAGSRKQKETFLPLFTGYNAGLAAFALTEPSGGSDLDAMTTFADITSQGFIVNGRKEYILNAPEACMISLFAMTDRLQKKASMRCFVIPSHTAGLRIGSTCDLAALDYARISEIVFDNMTLTPDMVIKGDEPYSGYLLLSQTLDIGRVLVGATSVGIARAALELANSYADQRVQFGKNIKNHQAIAHTLAEMATRIESARLMTWKACWLIDRGDDFTAASAMAKLSASIIAQEVTCMAADILGASAYLKGCFMEQLLRDARILSTIEGTNYIQRSMIASLL